MLQKIVTFASLLGLIFLVACAAAATPSPENNLAPLPTPLVLEPTAPAPVPDPVIINTPNTDLTTVDEGGETSIPQEDVTTALAQVTTAELSQAEIDDLLFMREEEKLAHDVYITLYAQWNMRLFQNIANSETTHTEAIRTLLTRYNLSDPALDNGVGVFTNATLQTLYGQLVAQGSESLAAALQVGATIEDLDITDLAASLAQTDNPDIILVYENLMKGSRNHLRAFVSTLQQQTGTTYQPQYLDQATYDAIINGAMESGNGQGSGGNGRRGNNGSNSGNGRGNG